jgi:hypothetical protein
MQGSGRQVPNTSANNVRDLLHPVHPVSSLVVLALFLYWSLGFPVVSAFTARM